METATVNSVLTAAIEPVITGTLASSVTTHAVAWLDMKSWYSITNKAGEDEAEIKIYEDIGMWGVSAKRFSDDLEKIVAKRIHVRINSYGGEAFDGIAIFNALRAHPADIIIHVDGIAASAASIIAMSGDEIRMADNAFLMIHEARGGVFGEAEDMRKYSELLDKLNDSIAGTYQVRAGKTRKYWRDKMGEETWYTAKEAKAEGLTDKIDDRESQAENRFDFKIYNHVQHVPAAVLSAWGKPNQQAPVDSSRDEPPPAVSTQEPSMATETVAAPAQISVAPAVPIVSQEESRNRERAQLKTAENEGHYARGRREGGDDARKAEMARLDAILAACPDKAMALDAYRGGQSADAVKMAYDAKLTAESRAAEAIAEKDMEIARLRALNAAGGHSGVEMDFTTDEEEPVIADPKAHAENEWDHKPTVRRGFTSKENYVSYRTAQLEGRISRTPVGARE